MTKTETADILSLTSTIQTCQEVSTVIGENIIFVLLF